MIDNTKDNHGEEHRILVQKSNYMVKTLNCHKTRKQKISIRFKYDEKIITGEEVTTIYFILKKNIVFTWIHFYVPY